MRHPWRAVLGFGVTALLIWWVFRGTDVPEVWAEIQGANFWLLGLAVAIATSNYVLRSIRWGYLLHPIQSGTSFRSRFAAVNIGFMATNLLPARAGELVRPYALSRMEPVSMSGAFGSLVVERFLDALTILALVFVALSAPGFPDQAVVSGVSLEVWIRGVMVVLGGVLLFMVLLLLFPKPLVSFAEKVVGIFPGRISRFLLDVLEAFLDGLGVFQRPALLLRAGLWSLAIWVVQSLAFWVAFFAFGIDVSFDVALFVNGMVALAVAAPAAPGFVGTFHAGVVAGLGVYAAPPAAALGLAFGLHLGGFIPVTIIGVYYAWKLGISFGDVKGGEPRIDGAAAEASD
ncbi:MAG: flippase-like domain-containing protein [Gemmatimonadetes bacterium]|nr:flippase-like domain-containing protein [Gemmatimonadota bacterium]NNM05920.1 flippase-like domain-containing protein [Gemmatimonadota bacterium]